MTTVAYVDASAIVKLIVPDPESESFHRWYVEAERIVMSRVGLVEIERAARRQAHIENRRMQAIARKYEAELRFEHGEVIGEIMPAGATYFSLMSEAVDDRVSFMLAVLDLQSRLVRVA